MAPAAGDGLAEDGEGDGEAEDVDEAVACSTRDRLSVASAACGAPGPGVGSTISGAPRTHVTPVGARTADHLRVDEKGTASTGGREGAGKATASATAVALPASDRASAPSAPRTCSHR